MELRFRNGKLIITSISTILDMQYPKSYIVLDNVDLDYTYEFKPIMDAIKKFINGYGTRQVTFGHVMISYDEEKREYTIICNTVFGNQIYNSSTLELV